jgi:hypothetical protein
MNHRATWIDCHAVSLHNDFVPLNHTRLDAWNVDSPFSRSAFFIQLWSIIFPPRPDTCSARQSTIFTWVLVSFPDCHFAWVYTYFISSVQHVLTVLINCSVCSITYVLLYYVYVSCFYKCFLITGSPAVQEIFAVLWFRPLFAAIICGRAYCHIV